jgi:hypothetical protein
MSKTCISKQGMNGWGPSSKVLKDFQGMGSAAQCKKGVPESLACFLQSDLIF